MIELFGMGNPNVSKIAIMLEETGQPYRKHHVSVMRGENFQPSFLSLNPLGKVPVVVDQGDDGSRQTIFESGAILIYLAEVYAPRLLPSSGPARWQTLEWLTAQVALIGPMLGQWNHFLITPEETDSYASRRYQDQAGNVYRLLNQRLDANAWLAGDEYSKHERAPREGRLGQHSAVNMGL